MNVITFVPRLVCALFVVALAMVVRALLVNRRPE
jgi:hypothetical protein